MPWLYGVGFAIAAELSLQIAQGMPGATGSGSLDIVGFGSIATDLFFLPLLIVQGMLLGLEVFTIQWVMPYAVILFFSAFSGLGDTEMGDKVYNTFLSLSVTAIFSQVLMTLTIVVGSQIVSGIQSASQGAAGALTFGYWLVVTITMLVPIFLYRAVRKRVRTFRAIGAIGLSGQIHAAGQNRSSASMSAPAKTSKSNTVGMLAVGAAAGIAGDKVEDALKGRHDDLAARARRARMLSNAAKAASSNSAKSATVGMAAGPLGIAALTAASAVQAKSKKAKQEGGSP
jgi:hypothetical protein